MLTEFLHHRTVFGIRDGDMFDTILQKIGDRPYEIGRNQLDSKALHVNCAAVWEIHFFDDQVVSISLWNAWNFSLHLKIESEDQVASCLTRYGLGVLHRREPDDIHIDLDLSDGMGIVLRREAGTLRISYLGKIFPTFAPTARA